MKKTLLIFMVVLMVISGTAFGQSGKKSVEVLYFKANLACCKARACDALQADVDSVLKKNFAKEDIDFKVIMLADEANKDLIAKYNAESQTVVFVEKKRNKESAIDLSPIVRDYVMNRDKEKFENEFTAKISEVLK